MALELTGLQKRKLREALIGAFRTWNELAELTLFQLDLSLPTIAGEAAGLNAAALNLIEWASGRGLLAELVVGARNERPKNSNLSTFADSLQLTSCPVAVLEKFVNDNVLLLDVAFWRQRQVEAEWRVCRLEFRGEGTGTGFLVGPDLVLTNYHVIEKLLKSGSELGLWCARFDYKVSSGGDDILPGRKVSFAEAWDVDHSAYSSVDVMPDPKPRDPAPDELDYALVRLAEPIGDQAIGGRESTTVRGWVEVRDADVDMTTKRMISILQHPQGAPMKLAMGMVEKLVTNTAGNRIRHGVPTLPGSSGSPLFDQDWNLIALHHAGDPRTIKPEFNEAIPIALIARRPEVRAALRLT
jgi:hypothetical protein